MTRSITLSPVGTAVHATAVARELAKQKGDGDADHEQMYAVLYCDRHHGTLPGN